MKLQQLLFLYLLLCAHANVFDKYIQLKRSLKQSSLPARQVLLHSHPSSTDPHLAKAESDMRAAMLSKPAKTSRLHKHQKLASGHTFLPSINTTTSTTQPPATQPSAQSQTTAHTPPQEPPHRAAQHAVHAQHVMDAVVGQGGRTGHAAPHGQPLTRNVWKGSKAVPVVLVSVLIWACAIASRKSDARRKARVLKKRLTNPRMVA